MYRDFPNGLRVAAGDVVDSLAILEALNITEALSGEDLAAVDNPPSLGPAELGPQVSHAKGIKEANWKGREGGSGTGVRSDVGLVRWNKFRS